LQAAVFGSGDQAEIRPWECGFARLFSGVLAQSGCPIGQSLSTCAASCEHWIAGASKDGRRQRDLLPLPVQGGPPHDPAASLSRCIALGLNILNGESSQASPGPLQPSRGPTAAQSSCLGRLRACSCEFMNRLKEADFDLNGGVGLDSFRAPSVGATAKIDPERIDLPKVAGTCDAARLVPPGLWKAASDDVSVFAGAAAYGLQQRVPRVEAAALRQYTALVARELRCGKLGLARAVHAGGQVFAVTKASGGRMRKIWDGSLVSQAASRPPKPYRLANPSSFPDIFIEKGASVFMSKLDATTYFDQLRAPPALARWFAQPSIKVSDLCDYEGFTLDELNAHLLEGERVVTQISGMLFPCHLVWPMGYSWSSAIAQSCTVQIVKGSGVPTSAIVGMSDPMPQSQDELVFVTTDDVAMIHRSADAARDRVSRLKASFAKADVLLNGAKEEVAKPRMTALGCDIEADPPRVSPDGSKLARLVGGLLALLVRPVVDPGTFASMLGLLQWFFQLQRPCFAILNEAYAFASLEPQGFARHLPAKVLAEMEMALCLLPLLPADLSREWNSIVIATDASTSFGFGVSARQCTQLEAATLGRLAERRGDYVRFDEPDPVGLKPRHGTPFRWALGKRHFSTVVSKRARWKAPPGLLECHALVLGLRWLARSSANHGKRQVCLVDAKAVLGAFAKGRSSARAFQRVIRTGAAVTLASGSLVRYLYIPSEWNPADRPSRGAHFQRSARVKRRDTTSKSFQRARFGTLSERRWAQRIAALERLREGPYGGAFLSSDTDSSSSVGGWPWF
jgi:hypothetical protein